MLNERFAAALPIARSLKGAEDAMNETIRQIGTLLVDIANAKTAKGTRFSLGAGMAAGEQIALAAVSTMQGYQQMIAAHAHLATDRDEANLQTVNFGDTCPPQQGSASSELTPLRVVGE